MSAEVVAAIDCARLAQCSKQHVEQDRGYVYHTNEGTNTEWIHGVRGAVLDIAFNGTNSGTDWFYNFIAVPQSLDLPGVPADCSCHFGFSSKYLSVKDEVLEVVRNKSDKKTILVTGHSLGAAQATLCALHLQMAFPDRDVRLYAFGVPKVGNRAFERLFNSYVKLSKFYIYGNDIIESVPPGVLGYVYTTPITRLGQWKWYKPWSTADHDIMNYKNTLTNARTLPNTETVGIQTDEQDKDKEQQRKVQVAMAVEYGGLLDYQLKCGDTVDIVTDTEIIQVGIAHKWKHVLGEVLAYCTTMEMQDRKPHIHLFSYEPFNYEEPQRVCAHYKCLLTHQVCDVSDH